MKINPRWIKVKYTSMVINWYGENCFKIQSGEFTLLTDPITNQSGLQAPRGKVDVVVKTLSAWPIEPSEEESAFVISGPGSYEVKEIKVEGWPVEKESNDKFIKTAYLLKIDNIKVGLLGHISEDLEGTLAEHFEEVDALLLPSGGKPFIESKTAAKLARNLKAKLIIPSLFKAPGLKRKAEGPEQFLKELGQGNVKAEEKISFREKEIADFKLKVVLLKP